MNKTIQIGSAPFFYGVAVEPASEIRAEDAELIVDHAGLAVVVLRAEAEGEHVGKWARRINDVPVGIVGVLCGGCAGLRNVEDDVAVVVVARNVEHAVHRHGQQALDTACALLRAGLVQAPEVFERSGCAV